MNLVEKRERRRPLEGPKSRRKSNITMGLKKQDGNVQTKIVLHKRADFMDMKKIQPITITCGELDLIGHYQLTKKELQT